MDLNPVEFDGLQGLTPSRPSGRDTRRAVWSKACGNPLTGSTPAPGQQHNTTGGKAMIDDWLQQANCRGLPPSMFVFDESRGMMTTGMRRQIAQAKAICGECPVTAECLAYGNRHDLKGVWGGKTGRERRAMMPRHHWGHGVVA